MVAVIAALGGMLFGYDTGIISGAILYIKKDFPVSQFGEGFIVAAVTAGALLGALFAGRFTDSMGRRPTNLAAGVIFVLASAVCALAPGEPMLIAGRLLVGIGIGLTSVAAPMYIAEAAPPHIRGTLVTVFQLAVTVGILVAYVIALAFAPTAQWRWMLGLGVLPGAVLAAGMWAMPESPRWLVRVGRRPEAAAVLVQLRGTDAVNAEIDEIEVDLRREGAGSWAELLDPGLRPALLVGIGLAVVQQVTGINAIIYYAPQIFTSAGISSDSTALAATIGIGVINVAATFIAIGLVDRAGRKPLLIAGLAGMILSLAIVALAFDEAGKGGETLSVLTVGAVGAYIVSFAFSLGPVVWLMISEIYPIRVRAQAVAVSTAANWAANFAVSLLFPVMRSDLGSPATFLIYAVLGLLSVFFILAKVPETKNKTLEEIARLWR